MARLMAVLFVMALSGPAAAQSSAPQSAPPTAFSVPVEKLELEKGKGKFFETSFSVGGYDFFSRSSLTQTETGLTILGSDQKKSKVRVGYRFLKSDGSKVASGVCNVETKSFSGLWNTAVNSLYTCQFNDLSPVDYALEVAVPNIPPHGGGFLAVWKIDPDKYKVLKARMLYKGITYEAVPTALDIDREAAQERVAKGYVITLDGKAIGQIDFKGNSDNRGTITAPVAEADGREAVIFLSAQLLDMPEANSPALK